jgi:hypothetical protein
MTKSFLPSHEQTKVSDVERFHSSFEVTFCSFAFSIVYATLGSFKRNVHRQHQIDILRLDPEDCQKDVYCVRYSGVELGNELDAFEDYRGRSFVSPVVQYLGDAFYGARCSRVIMSQRIEMKPRDRCRLFC